MFLVLRDFIFFGKSFKLQKYISPDFIEVSEFVLDKKSQILFIILSRVLSCLNLKLILFLI